MKRLSDRNPIISQMIGLQSYNKNKEYLKSPYLIIEEIDCDFLVYNTLTYELVTLKEEEYETQKEYLVKHWFLIEKDIDSYSICTMLKQIYRQTRKKKKLDKISTYVILPTTLCNARCPYCYERSHQKKDMTQEMAKDVLNFIRNTHDNKIGISWFGGEPLCNGEVISYISRGLRSFNIPYTSSMISNGLLFDKYSIDTIKYLWNLTNVQITLDGTQEMYNKVKGCIESDISDAFNKVLSNIEYLISNEIKVVVRLNISEDNIDDLKNLCYILKDRFSQYTKYFSVYSHPLFDEFNTRAAADSKKISEGYIEIQKLLMELGLFGRYDLMRLHMCTNCMGDNLKTVTINPDGKLGICEHYYDDVIIGDVYNYEFDQEIISEWQQPIEKDECKTCVFYPQCTKISHCPVGTCNEDAKNNLNLQIRTSMKYLYRRNYNATRENN